MFHHRIEPFGTFEKHVFSNDKGDSFAVVPQFGACLLDLKFSNISVLDGYTTPSELMENKWSKNIILLPYPNRLRDGRYVHNGKTHQFDLTNAATQNSIHGFGKDAPMQVEKVKVTEKSAGLRCVWKYDGHHAAYPFPFAAFVMMTLREGQFKVSMSIFNEGTAEIPVGLGWHPYFKMSEKSNDSSLKMPDCQLIGIDERMLPTGEKTPFSKFKRLTPIKETTLDNGFYINNQTKNAETVLTSEQGRLTFWQETGHQKWNFLQVFTPPHRKSVAIEPMTCNIDAFNNGDGLVMLKPSEGMTGAFGVRFKKK
jgi:aldose 1-epimerase